MDDLRDAVTQADSGMNYHEVGCPQTRGSNSCPATETYRSQVAAIAPLSNAQHASPWRPTREKVERRVPLPARARTWSSLGDWANKRPKVTTSATTSADYHSPTPQPPEDGAPGTNGTGLSPRDAEAGGGASSEVAGPMFGSSSGEGGQARQCDAPVDADMAERASSRWTAEELQHLADRMELLQLGEHVVLPRGLTAKEARVLLGCAS